METVRRYEESNKTGDDIERSKKRQMGTMETMQRNRKGLKYIKKEEEWRSVDESMEG
jgi:hypothetical protein